MWVFAKAFFIFFRVLSCRCIQNEKSSGKSSKLLVFMYDTWNLSSLSLSLALSLNTWSCQLWVLIFRWHSEMLGKVTQGAQRTSVNLSLHTFYLNPLTEIGK
jgi:hypothetical protein